MTFEELKIYSIQVIDALEHKKDRELGKHDEKEKKKQEELLINQIAFNVLSISQPDSANMLSTSPRFFFPR